MKAVILAAGYATRLYPLTENIPKPLLSIGDKPIIEHLLERFCAVTELDHVYVVTNDKFYRHFIDWAGSRLVAETNYPFAITIVNDGTTQNESRLGAIADAQFVIDTQCIDDDLIVAAGDNIFRCDFGDIFNWYKDIGNDVIVAQRLDDPERLRTRGVVQFDSDYQVIRFEEKPEHPPSNFVCPALYFHHRSHIGMYKTYLSDNNSDAPGHFIRWLYTQISVYVYVMSKPAIDIGTLETYQEVCRDFKKNGSF